MPKRRTRVFLDQSEELLEDLDRPGTRPDRLITAEEVLDTFSTPTLEGIATILGTIPGNSWASSLTHLPVNLINQSSTRTRRVRRETRQERVRTVLAEPLPQDLDVPVDEEPMMPFVTDVTHSTPIQIRKMRGKIVICQKAMNGYCPVLIDRENETDSNWCDHMVPHAHKGDRCGEPYEREYSLPTKYMTRKTCREASCNPMEPIPEHRRWKKAEKKSKGKLPHHNRTLIID